VPSPISYVSKSITGVPEVVFSLILQENIYRKQIVFAIKDDCLISAVFISGN
jgi:hypothetical protein